jgi:hypothetical protein
VGLASTTITQTSEGFHVSKSIVNAALESAHDELAASIVALRAAVPAEFWPLLGRVELATAMVLTAEVAVRNEPAAALYVIRPAA